MRASEPPRAGFPLTGKIALGVCLGLLLAAAVVMIGRAGIDAAKKRPIHQDANAMSDAPVDRLAP